MWPKTCSRGWTRLCTVLSSSTQPTRCIFLGTQSRKPAPGRQWGASTPAAGPAEARRRLLRPRRHGGPGLTRPAPQQALPNPAPPRLSAGAQPGAGRPPPTLWATQSAMLMRAQSGPSTWGGGRPIAVSPQTTRAQMASRTASPRPGPEGDRRGPRAPAWQPAAKQNPGARLRLSRQTPRTHGSELHTARRRSRLAGVCSRGGGLLSARRRAADTPGGRPAPSRPLSAWVGGWVCAAAGEGRGSLDSDSDRLQQTLTQT